MVSDKVDEKKHDVRFPFPSFLAFHPSSSVQVYANTRCLIATDQVGRLRQQVGPSLSPAKYILFLTMRPKNSKVEFIRFEMNKGGWQMGYCY